MIGRYAALFRTPGVSRLAAASMIGRLSGGMMGLALTLAVVESTGSYATAGVTAAVNAVGIGIAGPMWSRLADRTGARTVLVVTGIGQPLALSAAAAVASSASSGSAFVIVAGVAGVFLPPLGSVMRSLWSRLLPHPDTKAAAFALESVIVDAVFIVGPSLVGGVTALASPSTALLVAATSAAIGCLLVAASPRTRGVAVGAGGERHWLGPLRYPVLVGLLPIGLLLIGSINVIELSLVSFAGHVDRPAMAGVLIALLSAGSVVGGLYWGGHRQPGAAAQQLTVLLAALGAGWFLLVLPDEPWLLGAVLVLAGSALSPAITAMFSTMDAISPPEVLTESFAWLNALGAAGAALGTPVTGALTESGPDPGFWLAAAMCASGAAVCLGLQRRWRPRNPRPDAGVQDHGRDHG